jgi:hypothetical protein
LDIDWETYNEGVEAAALVGPAVLIYQAPDGGMRTMQTTEDASDLCREALLSDIQQLGP